MNRDIDSLKESWNQKAQDWNIQVGEEGDRNRRENSDPFLWEMLGTDLKDKNILDAGCGTGYLSRKIAKLGGKVIGIDISEKMIEIAQNKSLENQYKISFQVDSVETLQTVQTDSIDVIISNYVLQDTPDLEEVIKSFARVLKPDEGSKVIVVITHPCFPLNDTSKLREDNSVYYKWTFPYLSLQKEIIPAWGHFSTNFISYHRPLSYYWKTFSKYFCVGKFDEPYVQNPSDYNLTELEYLSRRMRPNSIIFELRNKMKNRNS